ncbi:MAG: CDF family Co(II)/Ni(II) efflux transporter DmeF [Lamprobacter sp.]|uniref:CDF family Co(II)/Ni(II) efflux transporter DmeF n=1 Tax=Lamprobacter sp. TaxID=3100796 RepID=UPI002B26428F|nr:CDF family Co(II)/Ni(II) efflux transporter DmeF [Lamprobacter sp.]MEA3638885.1 CDF family Co(II)/Ni(II) efflux transporter DmeF [Lamprobacter sp.]
MIHPHCLEAWQHQHDFSTSAEVKAKQRTGWVVYLTLVTMVVELTAGWLTGSMALLADGWHMGSHAAALGLTLFAYGLARRWANDPRFTFGTGKIPTLAGYSSALLLGLGAVWMLVESISRLLQPIEIRYADAMLVACLGLLVNLVSAWILTQGGGHHHHHHEHGHPHGQPHDHDSGAEHKDHNLRAAYFHVLADAMTSLLAIVALGAGMLLGWRFLDPVMGLVGAALIGSWAWGLARDSARSLLDAEDHSEIAARIRTEIEADPDIAIADLHLWRIGAASRACILSLVTHDPRSTDAYKERLRAIPGLDHLSVEVHQCRDERCLTAA